MVGQCYNFDPNDSTDTSSTGTWGATNSWLIFRADWGSWTTNACNWPPTDGEEAKKERDRLATKAALRLLRKITARVLTPVLRVFRKFDFRGAPRWRSLRWGAKT